MRRWYWKTISGESSGLMPALLRGILRAASLPYSTVVALRNRAFDRAWKRPVRLGVPVVSIGNITTGGTGKTPTVIMVVKQLQALGNRPAVLTRGYGAKSGKTPDEVLVMQRECPGLPIIVNPDRVAGGRAAINDHHADVLVLDDGFQHRRLARDLNVVLVDATMPMGIPGLLPRGTWREPPHHLARADAIMLTRCEQVTEELADLAAGLLSQWVTPRHIFQQSTRVVGLFDSAGMPVEPSGQRVVVFAGIGNPEGFLRTVRGMNLNVSAAFWFKDHYPYDNAADFAKLEALLRRRPVDALVTTMKDWVKVQHLPLPAPVWNVQIDCFIKGVGEGHWKTLLASKTAAVLADSKPAVANAVGPDLRTAQSAPQ